MALDLTLVAVPGYFATMGLEHRALQQRAQTEGSSSVDYEANDTRTSLTMGVLNVLLPFATHRVARHLAIGRGRHARKLVALAAGAAVVTTVADRVAGLDAGLDAEPDQPEAPTTNGAEVDPDRQRRRRWSRLARRVRRVSGPTAIGAAALSAGATTTIRWSPEAQWRHARRDLGNGPLAWTLGMVGWDVVYYWNHRFMHECRLLWAHHVVHHSSERYNLSTALRQPIADILCVFVPVGFLSRVGVRPSIIAQSRAINLLYQYWIHTDVIDRLPERAEQVLNTPSHHRVHHGSQPQYIDRNHGGILITWDRWFGTFEPEDEPVVYGLTKNVGSYNPAIVGSHEHVDILRDVARSTTWRERLSYTLRGPGWAYEQHRRRGVEARADEAGHVDVGSAA